MSQFVTPHYIFTGENALDDAKNVIGTFGKKALLVTGRHIGKSPMFKSLTDTLNDIGTDYAVFDGITGEPTDTMIAEGLEIYKTENCDFLIGIGGGSPLDSAKAIAAMSVNPGKICDYNGKVIEGKVPPIVAIPTTAGTGSEATKFTIVTDTEKGIKMLLKGDCLVPEAAVINPEYTVDMPKTVTAATGLDALTHAVEAYTSVKAGDLTDDLAVSAVKRIVKYLPRVYKNGCDMKARNQMLIAAFEAGICINNSSVTIVHGMSRPIGALFHVPHGLSNAMLLKECIGFALDGAYERFADLGRAVGAATKDDVDEMAARKFLEKLSEVCEACEVPTLKEYGIDRDKFHAVIEKMAEDAIASGSPANTRKQVTKTDCIEIYKKLI